MAVSIIIPCHNYGHFLAETIESVLNQTYQDEEIEIIIVNDGSTDNTTEIAKKYPVKLLLQSNQGLPTARNNGILCSRGRYILPLDADDKIHPKYLEKAILILKDFSSVGVVYTHRQHFGLLQTIKFAEDFSIKRLRDKCILNYCSLFRKEVWIECGGYNPNLKMGYEDWDFWLRVAEGKWEFKLLDEILFYYRKHGFSLSDIAKQNHEELFDVLKANHPKIYI